MQKIIFYTRNTEKSRRLHKRLGLSKYDLACVYISSISKITSIKMKEDVALMLVCGDSLCFSLNEIQSELKCFVQHSIPVIIIYSDPVKNEKVYRSGLHILTSKNIYKDSELWALVMGYIRPYKKKAKDSYLSIKYKNEIIRLNQKNIIYMEVFRKKVKIVTGDNIYDPIYMSLSSVKEKLNDNFIIIYRGVIVNKNYIKSIHSHDNTISLHNTPTILPVSKRCMPHVKVQITT